MEIKAILKQDVAIIGAGPAGLVAACEAARKGVKTAVFDENAKPGGQLFKQIHKFFGSSSHSAGMRGTDIGQKLLDECEKEGVEIYLNAIVYGIFPENGIGAVINGRSVFIQAKKILIATGATEKPLAFEGWDKPGVMGAGAFQTMMNVNYVLPGKKVVMVGSGNVGLVVAYQIMQAGGKIAAVVEAAPQISGYGVHADKLKRQGVRIWTGCSVKRALGKECVEQVEIAKVGRDFKFMEGTEMLVDADTVCVAVGLVPSVELLEITGVKMTYMPAMGGFIPLHSQSMQTTNPDIYVAGDASGIEEASSAMEEGRLAGMCMAYALGRMGKEEWDGKREEILERLNQLRGGKGGQARRRGNEEIVRRYEEWKKLQENR